MSRLHIDLEPIMYVGRGYVRPDGRKRHDPYDLVFSVFMLGDGRARAFATHGEMSRATVMNAARELRALGVHTVLADRHGVEEVWTLPHVTQTNPDES